jgi:hypothetical protein
MENENDRCAGCAFTPGTDANKSTITQLKARLAIESETIFYCHAPIEQFCDAKGITDREAHNLLIALGEQVICAGYLDAIETLHDKGYFDDRPEWKRKLSLGLLAVTQRVEDTPSMTEKDALLAIREVIEQVAADENLSPKECFELLEVKS